MRLPQDYTEKVYAGVLGKIVGVYLGRPFEGWENERIERELGEITGYVHERLGRPLVVPDDDISGTFVFIRALEDAGANRAITPAEIGHAWLNYLIEERTVLWWGGFGNATAHTAYLRLKRGLKAPASGSAAVNGQVVAEQIAAQIFADSWAMVAPGDPELAADLACRAGSVSSDGAALHASRVVAAMEASAFVEKDTERLIDTATALIPRDSLIARLIDDVRDWHAAAGSEDWRSVLTRIRGRYGYDRYGGNCHVVPNHALIIMALLAGGGDFDRSLSIVNTAGWDTDCNSGNVGCLLGIRGGLTAIGERWRAPVADRLYLPSADAGEAVTDATRVADRLVALGHRLAGAEPPAAHARKGGARFHFEYPGSVQGFRATGGKAAVVENVTGHSATGARSLAVRFPALGAAAAAVVTTPTSFPGDRRLGAGYGLQGSPTLHPGQLLRLAASGAAGNADTATLVPLLVVAVQEGIEHLVGPELSLAPGASDRMEWTVPETGGNPVVEVGVRIAGPAGAGAVYLDYLDWSGVPCAHLGRPGGQTVTGRPLATEAPWRRAWANGVDLFENRTREEDFRLIQNAGIGLLIRGDRTWRDYTLTATVRLHMATAGGIGVRVQGMRRYYALLITGCGRLRLIRRRDDEETILDEAPLGAPTDRAQCLTLSAAGTAINGRMGDRLLVSASDTTFDGGAVALLCTEGRVEISGVHIAPVPNAPVPEAAAS